MLPIRAAFASFSTDDLKAAKRFYGTKLGLEVRDTPMGVLEVLIGADQHVTIYPKPKPKPATFTVLNFIVPDIDAAVAALRKSRITMERYRGMQQDAKGIARDPRGPAMAWFKDNAGNILSVLEDRSVGE